MTQHRGLAVPAVLAHGFQLTFPHLHALVPFFFRLVRIDPAIAAGPAVTTIDDIVAIGIYYVVAIPLLSG